MMKHLVVIVDPHYCNAFTVPSATRDNRANSKLRMFCLVIKEIMPRKADSTYAGLYFC